MFSLVMDLIELQLEMFVREVGFGTLPVIENYVVKFVEWNSIEIENTLNLYHNHN